MSVKFMFDKSETGERRIIITKDGGFEPEILIEVMNVVEKMFDGEENSEDEENEVLDLSQKPETDGRGKPAGELPDGTKVRHDGQIDGRSLRGAASVTPEQATQTFADRLKKAAPAGKSKAQEK